MVNAVYDHIIAILVIGAIFVGAVVALPAISFVGIQAVDQQQLRNTALNVFNAILLSTGSPPYWGSIPKEKNFGQENVTAFGLAYSDECSLYVLDSDKVQRLDQESDWHMDYSRVRELLKLNGYGFSLTLFRPFTVNWKMNIFDNETPKRVWFQVNVTRSEDGTPIPNAQVRYTIMVSASHDKHGVEPIANITQPKIFFTDVLGRCEVNEFITIPTGYSLTSGIAVLEISVAGMSTTVVARTDKETLQNFVKIYTFGDTITLKVRNEFLKQGGGERRVRMINSYSYGEELMQIFDGRESNPPGIKITPGEGYETWSMTFPGLKALNPALLLFTLRVKQPDRLVIIAGPFSFGDPTKVFSFNSDSEPRDVAIKLRRFVVISGMTYVAELALWKEQT